MSMPASRLSGVIEEMLVRDIVDLRWEMMRRDLRAREMRKVSSQIEDAQSREIEATTTQADAA